MNVDEDVSIREFSSGMNGDMNEFLLFLLPETILSAGVNNEMPFTAYFVPKNGEAIHQFSICFIQNGYGPERTVRMPHPQFPKWSGPAIVAVYAANFSDNS